MKFALVKLNGEREEFEPAMVHRSAKLLIRGNTTFMLQAGMADESETHIFRELLPEQIIVIHKEQTSTVVD